MSFERIGLVFGKEVIDNLRDRRTLITVLLSTLIGPGMVFLLFTVIGHEGSERADRPLALPVSGAENAPSLVAFLEQNGAEVVAAPEDPEAGVRAGDHEVVLIVPPSYREEFGAGQPATVRLVVDESRQSAGSTVRRARALLEGYNQQIATLRLMARGISPAVVSVLAVENVDVSTPQSMAAMLLYVVPFFLIFAVFGGGMYLAIDTTAGERERGSLEPLLINPVARRELLLGKLGATLVFTFVTVVGTLVAFALMLRLMPLDAYFGVQFGLNLESLGTILLITVPMMLLAAALQIIIATYTRSFKEAQSYLGFLPLIPGLPGMVMGLLPVKVDLWAMLIPTFGQQMLINQVLRGEPVSPLNSAVSAVVTIVAGIGLVLFAIRLYEREELPFGR